MARERVDVPPGDNETWISWVKRVGKAYDQTVSDAEADFILWERTCFPMNTDKAMDQVHQFFRKFS